MRLRHGTTKERADAILRNGPDPNFVEPGDILKARGFSTAPLHGPYPYGSPEDCALGKANLFPDEGGPAIVEVDVPDAIAALAIDAGGEIRFEPGYGLAELLAAWPGLPKGEMSP